MYASSLAATRSAASATMSALCPPGQHSVSLRHACRAPALWGTLVGLEPELLMSSCCLQVLAPVQQAFCSAPERAWMAAGPRP